MSCVIVLEALEGSITVGPPAPAGSFLMACDPDANAGRGSATWTGSIAKALRFAGPREALMCWQQQSTRLPLRPDGQPNRPLTAYTVSLLEVPG